ncbi:MAG: ATP cone domain-containing protein, partial [Clostridiales bacterium]|nr:ATP cone domain-containing protein [Clostridiales bacterium]
EETINEIEKEIFHLECREIDCNQIGEIVMEHLKDLDQVAYVRFASVYRDFSDLQQFTDALKQLKKHK